MANDRAVGTGLMVELYNLSSKEGYYHLLIPTLPDRSKLVSYTRTVQEATKRTSWARTEWTIEPTATSTREEIMKIAAEAGEPIMYALGQDWVVGCIVAVDISAEDAADISKGERTPAHLVARAFRARLAAGRPETTYPPHGENTPVTEYQRKPSEQVDDIEAIFINENASDAYIRAFAAVVAGRDRPKMGSYINHFRNEESAIKGRTRARIVDAVPAATLLDAGEDTYTRPNGEAYYTRAWGEHRDVPVIRKARAVNRSVFLYGPPGTGKTALVEASFGTELVTIMGTGDTEVGDLVGGYIQLADGSYEWKDGPLVIAAIKGLPILIDEIGLINTKVLSVLYSLMDGRRELVVTANPARGIIKAKEGFFVIAATNPNAPGVMLSEALLSRFAIHAEVRTDWALLRRLLGDKYKDLLTLATNLSGNYDTGEASWAPQYREVMDFVALVDTFGVAFAAANLIASAPEGERPTVASKLNLAYGATYLGARI